MAVTPQSVQTDNQRALRQMVANLSSVVDVGVKSTSLSLPQVGVELSSAIKQKVSGPGRGRVYRGRRGRGDHQASAPGDPPAVDTGQYRDSWAWAVGPGYVEVGTNMEQGPSLEFGSSDMAPRPHVRPTVAEYTRNISGRIGAAHTVAQRGQVGETATSGVTTLEGAIKGAVVATGAFGPRVWRGNPPDGETLPYATFYGLLALVPALRGDGRTIARNRQMQLDLWHDGADEEAAESHFETVLAALDGLRVPSTPKSFRIRVSLAVRVPDRKLVHHSLTLVVDHGVT